MQTINMASPLLQWYFDNERTLPWRLNSDPYRIWLSEIMLQQTQVITVIDYFNRFTAAYPNLEALASADEHDVFKLWEGLGYYSRARNLLRCAKTLVSQYDGQFPQDLKTMLSLPGIGPYTAGAILSIAFNQAVPAVDGNVMRVMSRLYASYEDIGNPKTRPHIEAMVMANLPEDRRHFNQALMELGALVCTPRSPQCDLCPLTGICQAFKQSLVTQLPIKLQKIKKTKHHVPVALVFSNHDILLVKKSGEGLLSGLWGLPLVELSDESPADDMAKSALGGWLSENIGIESVRWEVALGETKHVFTHKTWLMTLWPCHTDVKPQVDFPEMAWVSPNDLSHYPMSTAMLKLIRQTKPFAHLREV